MAFPYQGGHLSGLLALSLALTEGLGLSLPNWGLPDVPLSSACLLYCVLRQALHHRPFNPEAPAYKEFKDKTMLKLSELRKKYTNFAL